MALKLITLVWAAIVTVLVVLGLLGALFVAWLTDGAPGLPASLLFSLVVLALTVGWGPYVFFLAREHGRAR